MLYDIIINVYVDFFYPSRAYLDITGPVSELAQNRTEWRPDTTLLCWGASPAVTAVPTPRIDPDISLPLAHISIAGEVASVSFCVPGSPLVGAGTTKCWPIGAGS